MTDIYLTISVGNTFSGSRNSTVNQQKHYVNISSMLSYTRSNDAPVIM